MINHINSISTLTAFQIVHILLDFVKGKRRISDTTRRRKEGDNFTQPQPRSNAKGNGDQLISTAKSNNGNVSISLKSFEDGKPVAGNPEIESNDSHSTEFLGE